MKPPGSNRAMNPLKYLTLAILLLGWGCATTENATHEYDPSDLHLGIPIMVKPSTRGHGRPLI